MKGKTLSNSYLAFTAPDEGEFCLTEILGNKITLLSCPISLAIGFLKLSRIVKTDDVTSGTRGFVKQGRLRAL